MSMNAAGPRLNLGYHDVMLNENATGYGVFGKELHDALERAGVADYGPTTDPTLEGKWATMENGNAFPVPFAGETPELNDKVAPVAFYAATPPHVIGWYEGQKGVLFTMWEFSDMPAGFRENVPEFDRILVPSQQNVELFSRFHNDVQYIPLAAEKMWKFTERKDPDQYFEFLTGGAGPRKGNEDVVRAFNTVFAKWQPSWGPEPRLTVRTRPSLGNRDFAGARVRVFSERMSNDAYVRLYEQAHCFISGSKGEGWGLMPFQAITQGCPTILGNAHGHAAFARYGIPLDVDLRDAGVPTHWGSSGSEWVPDFDQMCEAIEYVYRNWTFSKQCAEGAALAVREEFSWDKTAQKVIEAVPEMSLPDVVAGEWKKVPQRVYPVVVKHHETWAVNGRLTTFDPGFLYERPWSDKVRLAESGNLDPRCIDVNEMGALGKPHGGPDRCPHCGQLYGLDESLYPENLQ